MMPSPMRLQKGRYVARMADGPADVEAAQRLRHSVFRASNAATTSLDCDEFDARCQHVLVEEADTGKLVCCFRMMRFASGADAPNGYSGQFYDLSALSAYSGPLIEIGRFCVANGAHDADVLRVAWGAVTSQVDEVGATLLFGCSSFEGASEIAHDEVLALLKDRHLAPNAWMPRPKAERVYPFARRLQHKAADARAALKAMPPLLRTYLAMGGWVSDHAVIDTDLDTLHVFTGVEIAAIPPARAKALRAIVG